MEELTDNWQNLVFMMVFFAALSIACRETFYGNCHLSMKHESAIILLMLSPLPVIKTNLGNEVELKPPNKRMLPTGRQFMLIFLFFLCILFLLIYHKPRNLQPNETTTDNEGKSDLEWGQTSNFSWNSNSNLQLNQTKTKKSNFSQLEWGQTSNFSWNSNSNF